MKYEAYKMANLVEGSHWTVDKIAQELHQQGLTLEVDQADYQGAHAAFGAARDRLFSLVQTPDISLQGARINRDDGFTYLRQWLNTEHSGDTFAYASKRLGNSSVTTEYLLRQEPDGTPRHKELLSEHGATLSCLGRLAVAEQVKSGAITTNIPAVIDSNRIQQRFFSKQEAHRFLRQGSNTYFRVSNAMHAARAERLNGKVAPMIPWLGQVIVGVGKSITSDRKNLLQSLKTVARIGWSMRSRNAAASSVLARP